LPARFEDAKAARAEIETAWRKDHAAGAVALQGGRIVGYLVGAPDDEAHWGGGNVWVGLAGHAVEDAETARDLYAVAAQRGEVADDEVGTLVAEVEGRIVGGFVVAPVERSGNVVHGHGSLARPERSCYLAWAATLPEARGSGAGVALTQASFAWARRAGYETM